MSSATKPPGGIFLDTTPVELNVSCTPANRHRAYRIVKNVNKNFPNCRMILSCSDRNKIVIESECTTERRSIRSTDAAARQVLKAKKKGILEGRKHRR